MTARKILFLGRSVTNASVRLRAYDYFPMWQDAGYTTVFFQFSKNPLNFIKLCRAVQSADLVIIIRKTLKLPIFWVIRLLAKKIIFDLDDAIFADPKGLENKKRHHRFVRMINNVDYVWAGNSFLQSEVQKFSKAKTIILPTGLDLNKYLMALDKPCGTAVSLDDCFYLAWIGSRSTKKYLLDALPILAKISANLKQEFGIRLCLKIISDFELEYPGLKIISKPWSKDTEALDLVSSHVGIAPMVDDIWTKGKCAFKVLQYMASGLPVLTSPVGMNKEVVIHGETGYLVSNLDEWTDAIVKLLQEASLREQMGASARKIISENYTVTVNFKKMQACANQLGL